MGITSNLVRPYRHHDLDEAVVDFFNKLLRADLPELVAYSKHNFFAAIITRVFETIKVETDDDTPDFLIAMIKAIQCEPGSREKIENLFDKTADFLIRNDIKHIDEIDDNLIVLFKLVAL